MEEIDTVDINLGIDPVGETPTDETQGKTLVMENQLTPSEVTSGAPGAPALETIADVPSDSSQKNEISTQ